MYRDSGGQPFLTPPYLILHREEFAWPYVSPHTPVRSYIKPRTAAPFHPSPWLKGWSILCCTCRRLIAQTPRR